MADATRRTQVCITVCVHVLHATPFDGRPGLVARQHCGQARFITPLAARRKPRGGLRHSHWQSPFTPTCPARAQWPPISPPPGTWHQTCVHCNGQPLTTCKKQMSSPVGKLSAPP
ncbi:hypothetical protein CERZMDRAFT_118009 [Cercospora zeae-maydis SCOH1-5]|uniref:Uncharacterized protein n=1 Tax=Cercospora zeae-maydis SCOH1-5 TaxID=717836 RepID=A0A6A6FC95_9PEZI|nr:hypothetical protein CERZMDRAFT_118009 [Cercospora zeae-maydis SCOH1-5]